MRGDGILAAGVLAVLFGVGVVFGRFGLRPEADAAAESERARLAAELYRAQDELRTARAEADALRRAATARPDPAEGGGRIARPDPPLPEN